MNFPLCLLCVLGEYITKFGKLVEYMFKPLPWGGGFSCLVVVSFIYTMGIYPKVPRAVISFLLFINWSD